ncbi:hypothetical protein C2857_000531 [Epichloe festucae Fl1]|uniref:COP9 signalosome complex subunit 6 n=1 Tax=Epichloe festucae (strain Fl1) TaxID=877507 RepID=A0A7U3SN25_EPIFF|nr:hypothetical protein C2857_000531 [Epichloe festucae Fl1]
MAMETTVAQPPPNPLVSSQSKSSRLQAVLHPLVLLSISDYLTRHSLREQKGPVIGAILGQQNGREITMEAAFDCHVSWAPGVEGGYLLDVERFSSRLEQMIAVHKDRNLELVGWYTLTPPTGPTPAQLPIHHQILDNWNDSAALLLAFDCDPNTINTIGGKLPLTIYETIYEVDGRKSGGQDGGDRKMQDGEPTHHLRFREVPYVVETDETEMISMNYVAAWAGTASSASKSSKEDRPSRSIESTGKGKRRLVEAEGDGSKTTVTDDATSVDLTGEEDAMIASLTAKANAIKMLHCRIRLITTYLECLPPSYTNGQKRSPVTGRMDLDHISPSLPILRQIRALINRLGLVVPFNVDDFQEEMRREANNANLTNLLNTVMQSISGAREVGKKFSIVEATKASSGRDMLEKGCLASPGFNMPGAGDIMI